jgi:hypothetical protein
MAITGPAPAQKWLPVIELPPSTPKPCSANTTPATVRMVPMSMSHPLSMACPFAATPTVATHAARSRFTTAGARWQAPGGGRTIGQ